MWKSVIICIVCLHFIWYFGDNYKRHKEWKPTLVGNTIDLYFKVPGILYNIILSPDNNIDEILVESG
jgi:hypothetical protein